MRPSKKSTLHSWLKAPTQSDEEDNELNNSSHKELLDAFESLNNDFEEIFKLNKVLKKKNESLEIEIEILIRQIKELENTSTDHSSCLVDCQKLKDEIDRIKKEF